MGEFLSLAAASGIQIIIETHSDHLMNGIRIACRKGIIDCNQVEMDLIGLDADGYTHTRRPVQLNPDGTVKNLVPGFFDEWEKALTSLILEIQLYEYLLERFVTPEQEKHYGE